MDKRILLLMTSLLGSSTMPMGNDSAENEALKRFRQHAQEYSDPVWRGLSVFGSRSKDPAESAERKEEIRRIIDELANDPDNDPKRILKGIKRESLIDNQETHQKEIDAIKWQNTLLTDPGNFIGLYKADFIQTGLLAADIYADIKLYRELTRRRIEKIYASMLKDVDVFISLLKRINESEARYEERMASMTAFAQMFTDQVRGRDILLNPLRRYLIENHALVKGYMPFNRETIVPLAARWVAEKCSEWVEEKLLVKSIWANKSMTTFGGLSSFFMNPQLQENMDARERAYHPNQAGYLQALKKDDTPFSVTTGFKVLLALVNPVKAVQKLTYNDTSNPWIGRLWYVNKFAGLGIPEILFSDAMRLGLEVVGIGFSAKFYDSINTAKWGSYVLQNRDDLLRLLYAYRRALDNASSGEDAIVQAEKNIRLYVEKGHESSSWVPGSALSEWWTTRDEGRDHIYKWLGYGTAALVTMKLGHWWFTRESTQPQS